MKIKKIILIQRTAQILKLDTELTSHYFIILEIKLET